MRKKTREIEDKGLTPDPSPVLEVMSTEEGSRLIKMRSGRGWNLGTRTLRAGETVTLDAETASAIVAAGYADWIPA